MRKSFPRVMDRWIFATPHPNTKETTDMRSSAISEITSCIFVGLSPMENENGDSITVAISVVAAKAAIGTRYLSFKISRAMRLSSFDVRFIR